MEGHEQKSSKILIIDDDMWICRLMSKYFESWGLLTRSCYNAIDGLATAVNMQPSLIMLDLLMPGISGYQVLQIMKKIDLIKDIPVVVVSGQLQHKELIDMVLTQGANGYLEKPFSPKSLFEKIKANMSVLALKRFVDIDKLSNQIINMKIEKEIKTYK
jgi:CheY-like chemotaxis protein